MFKTSTPHSLRLRTFSVWPEADAHATQNPRGAQNPESHDTVVWRVERLGPVVAAQPRPREVRVQVLEDEDSHPDWRQAA